MGLAHIGVLQWFEEHHIPVDRISGTSMGAFVGGLYASGRSVKDLHDIATGDALNGMFTLEAPYTDVSYRRRQDRRELRRLSSSDSERTQPSQLASYRPQLDKFLRNEFSAYNSHAIDYDRLPIHSGASPLTSPTSARSFSTAVRFQTPCARLFLFLASFRPSTTTSTTSSTEPSWTTCPQTS